MQQDEDGQLHSLSATTKEQLHGYKANYTQAQMWSVCVRQEKLNKTIPTSWIVSRIFKKIEMIRLLHLSDLQPNLVLLRSGGICTLDIQGHLLRFRPPKHT